MTCLILLPHMSAFFVTSLIVMRAAGHRMAALVFSLLSNADF